MSFPPADVQIDIVGSNGTVVTIDTTTGILLNSGNFTLNASVVMPYTARVRHNGLVVSSVTPQTSGDCNACHTEQGANGAAGRLIYPQ